MAVRKLVAGLLGVAVFAVLSPAMQAAVVAPVKEYVKPDEPIAVRFLNEKGDDAKKALAALGLEATKLDYLFTPVAGNDVVGTDGMPNVKVYTTAGEALKPASAKLGADGSLDLGAAFPQIKEVGTYYVVWKNAPPLVVESLRNAIPWDYEKDDNVPISKRNQMMQELANGNPVITRILPLQYAVITTDKGVIKAKFSYEVAPRTVDNFVELANQGMYDGSAFHRIMKNFMIQGGDSLANSTDRAGSGGPGYDVPAELSDKKHEKGTLSMARLGVSVDSAGSQFFIMHGKTPSLDGEYTAFGDVFEGMDVVDAIANTPSEAGSGAVAPGSRPKIISVRIVPATPEIYGIKK